MRQHIALALMFFAAALSACGGTCPPCDGKEGVAAVVNGKPITMAELDAAARGRLSRIDTEIYRTKKQVLESLIEEKLIVEAARRKGRSVEQLMMEEVTAKATVPTADEVRALYDARKGAIDKPFEEVQDQIASYLMHNRVAEARSQFLSKLREAGEVEVRLDPPRVAIETAGAPATGEAGAKVTLVEFSDYQCPDCRRVRPTIRRILEEYKGRVRYVFMDFPLSFHRDAKKAHEAAHCAGDQGKYFEYGRKLFDEQAALSVDDLKKYATELRLDAAAFARCLETGAHAELVDAMIARGAEAGVAGTPAFFINGIMIAGARPFESFQEIIDAELTR